MVFLQHGNLTSIIISDPNISEEEQTILELGHKMDNKAFRYEWLKTLKTEDIQDIEMQIRENLAQEII